jgi:hypothetical protein
MTKRKGRRLLLASLGVAAVSFVACEREGKPPPDVPPPNPTHYPMGNLRPVDPQPVPEMPDASDAGTQSTDAHGPGWNLPDSGAKDGWL